MLPGNNLFLFISVYRKILNCLSYTEHIIPKLNFKALFLRQLSCSAAFITSINTAHQTKGPLTPLPNVMQDSGKSIHVLTEPFQPNN